jgi:N utilization substance protein B
MNVPDVPAPVILNEAIEVAKNLGGNESGAFVNGVLHRLMRQIRPMKTNAPPPREAADQA